MTPSKKTSFIDTAKITVIGGKGGNGCQSFHSAGGPFKKSPDGGNGGNGGNVIIEADEGLQSLLSFQYNRIFTAQKGSHASSNRKAGSNGEDRIIKVPLGTMITDEHTGLTYRDLTTTGQRVIIAEGGHGGRGNAIRRSAEDGQPGVTRHLKLELRLVSDIALIGVPNAGRSSLITHYTQAHPKITDYPFATTEPTLGVCEWDYKRFTIVDLPSIIKGSHNGHGAGNAFLRHAERASFILYCLDAAWKTVDEVIVDYEMLIEEVGIYNPALVTKPCYIVLNRIDLSTIHEADLAVIRERLPHTLFVLSLKTEVGLATFFNALITVCNQYGLFSE